MVISNPAAEGSIDLFQEKGYTYHDFSALPRDEPHGPGYKMLLTILKNSRGVSLDKNEVR